MLEPERYRSQVAIAPDLGLIVNQCAEYMCTPCEAEGFFVPLQARGGWRLPEVLLNLFSGNGPPHSSREKFLRPSHELIHRDFDRTVRSIT